MFKISKAYRSWGRYPQTEPRAISSINWRQEGLRLDDQAESVLPFGYGRSYGDSCLNDDGVLLDTTGLNRFIAFDSENGILTCEAGVSLAEILRLIVPQGWFLAATPGTKFITVGGAIANDVHGKNHHSSGTFGCHVLEFELLRSDGERLRCSPSENVGYYRATIGGLGLTGVITWASFKLRKIPTGFIKSISIQFRNLQEFFALSEEYDHLPYNVSWADCLMTGKNMGRGLFGAGDFFDPPLGTKPLKDGPRIRFPFEMPVSLVNGLTTRIFNELYYHKQIKRYKEGVSHYNSFFYPLDAVEDWPHAYGRRGFLQYQFVIPYEESYEPLEQIFKRIVESGEASPLVVIKTFGDVASPGMLSFPRPGVTLALDFPFRGERTLKLLDELDAIVFEQENAALYPAKDARMSGESFRRSFPEWESFAEYIDPHFSSSFWRRVMDDVPETHAEPVLAVS